MLPQNIYSESICKKYLGVGGEDTLSDQTSQTAKVIWGEAQLQPSAAAVILIPAALTPRLLLNL